MGYYCIFAITLPRPFHANKVTLWSARPLLYHTYCVKCERGVVVIRGVKVGREEIDTRYGVMPMIHWCNDKGHFFYV